MNADTLLKELGIKNNASLDEKLAIVTAWYHQNVSKDNDLTGDQQTRFDKTFERILFYKNQFLANIRADLSTGLGLFHGKNAIQAAAMSGFDRWLSETDIDKNLINQADEHQMTPLALAIVGGHVHTVQVLFEKGADLHQETSFKQSPVFYSLMLPVVYDETKKENKIKLFEFFKKNAPDTLDAKNAEGSNLLHYAMSSNFTEILDTLLTSHPHLLKQANKHGHYPIHTAVLNNRYEAVQRIIGLDGIANQKDAKGRLALHYAAEYGKPAMLKLCLEHQQDIDVRDNLQRTPFMLAAKTGNIEALNTLLDKGANPLLTDSEGFNALHHAVLSGNIEAVRWLLTRTKIDVNESKPKGQTALSLSIHVQNPAITRLLQEHGARNSPS